MQPGAETRAGISKLWRESGYGRAKAQLYKAQVKVHAAVKALYETSPVTVEGAMELIKYVAEGPSLNDVSAPLLRAYGVIKRAAIAKAALTTTSIR